MPSGRSHGRLPDRLCHPFPAHTCTGNSPGRLLARASRPAVSEPSRLRWGLLHAGIVEATSSIRRPAPACEFRGLLRHIPAWGVRRRNRERSLCHIAHVAGVSPLSQQRITAMAIPRGRGVSGGRPPGRWRTGSQGGGGCPRVRPVLRVRRRSRMVGAIFLGAIRRKLFWNLRSISRMKERSQDRLPQHEPLPAKLAASKRGFSSVQGGVASDTHQPHPPAEGEAPCLASGQRQSESSAFVT